MFRSAPWALALSLLLPVSSLAQEGGDAAATTDPVDGGRIQNARRDPQEVEAFKQIQQRFAERTAELEKDTREYLASRKEEELAKVSDGYDALVISLEERERSQRDLAIARLKEFLVRYPAVPDSDNVRFRLAELYYEKAVESWLDTQANFSDIEKEYDLKVAAAEKALADGDPTLFEALEPLEPPLKDLERSIQLYQQIIARNEALPPEQRWDFVDRAYYSLGFSYMDSQAKQHDLLKARKAFQELLRVSGESSPLSDAAHMFLGKLLFEEEKKFDEALAEYRAIVEKGPKGSYYEDASFQLAWTYYKLAGRTAEFEPKALELFTRILDDSETKERETGKPSPYAKDARLNMARTLADIADRAQRSPIDVTQEYFKRMGERPWEREVYASLAEVLAGCVPVPEPCAPGTQNWGRFEMDAAIAVYEHMQTDPRWLKEADNPGYQMKIIWLLPHKTEQNLDEDIPREQKKLVDRYSETLRDPYTGAEVQNPWWVANRNNPDAIDTVRQFVEGSLSQVAIGLMQQAQTDNDPQLYRAASDKFREYLDKFPIADNFFANQWFLANALLRASPKEPSRPWGQYEEAMREFTSLVQSRDNHPYGDGAVFGIMSARKLLIEAKGDIHGPFDQLPKSAEVEEVITTPFGKQITKYRLSDDHTALIDAMDLLLTHKFGPSQEAGVPDYREILERERPYLLYTPGLILAKHNRFDEARARLERVLAEIPETKEASFAANLIVAMYNEEGNLEEVRNQTRRFRVMPFDGSDAKEKWGELDKDVAFIICQEKRKNGDRLGAAQCFEGYLAEFPDTKSEKYKFALYNAANNYDVVGRAEQANQLFEKYVELYPRDTESRALFIRIAGNYEATFDLKKAIYFYQKLIDNDVRREEPLTADAQYNVAFLKIGVGDFRGAAVGFEKYAEVYPDKPDAEDVMFMAGEEWEKVSEKDALAFYKRYLTKYGPTSQKANPSHIIEVKYRVAQLQKARPKDYEKAMDDVQATYDSYVASGTQLGTLAARYAAERAFQKLQVEYNTLIAAKLSGNEDKDIKLMEQKGNVEVPAFEESAKVLLSKYKDFEYGTGAFYLMGGARLYVAELVYALQCPYKSEEDCEIWWELYEENWRPLAQGFEDTARTRFQALIDQGKTQKLHSPWIDRAYETLNKLDPFSYPAVKDELRGDLTVQALPLVRPLDIPAPADPKGAPPKPAPANPAPGEAPPAAPGANEGSGASPWGGNP